MEGKMKNEGKEDAMRYERNNKIKEKEERRRRKS